MNSEQILSNQAKIITVYSPKEGAGCTMLAVNLASGLMNPDTKVLLANVDLLSNEADLMLYMPGGLKPSYINEHVQFEMWAEIVDTRSYGLTDTLILRTTPNELPRMLAQVSQNYDFIIVDTRSALDEFRMRLFEVSSMIVMITNPTLGSVRAVQKTIKSLDKHANTKGKTHLVINGIQPKQSLKHKDISHKKLKQYLPVPLIAEIPFDVYSVEEAAQNKIPLIAYDYQHKKRITRKIMAMTYRLHDEMLELASV